MLHVYKYIYIYIYGNYSLRGIIYNMRKNTSVSIHGPVLEIEPVTALASLIPYKNTKNISGHGVCVTLIACSILKQHQQVTPSDFRMKHT